MADDADIAQDIEQARLTAIMARRERHAWPEVGYCHNCGEGLPEGLFCDADCRDDYEKRERFRAMRPVDNV